MSEDGWRRLHPLTPLLRGGRAVAALGGALAGQGLRDEPAGLTFLALALAAVVAGLVGLVAWRVTRFRVTADELQIDSGLLVRRARRVPLARLQSVDVVRSLVARGLGLAELRLEVVGGSESEARLAYLPEADALALRDRLLGAPVADAQLSPPERLLVRVPTGALVTSVLLGAPLVIAAVAVLAAVVVLLVQPSALPALAAAALPGLLGTGTAVLRRLLLEYGSDVAEVPGGLRLRHGLLETRTQTVPPGRVQAVRVRAPLLWRRRDWVRVEVDVAGYAGRGEERAATASLLPVAPREVADAVLARVLQSLPPQATAPVPRRARWRAPVRWSRLGLGLDDRHLVTRSGVLTRTLDIVPLARVQSVRLVQGPWQRRLGLATVIVDTAGRRLRRAAARHRDAGQAARLVDAVADAARAARRPAG